VPDFLALIFVVAQAGSAIFPSLIGVIAAREGVRVLPAHCRRIDRLLWLLHGVLFLRPESMKTDTPPLNSFLDISLPTSSYILLFNKRMGLICQIFIKSVVSAIALPTWAVPPSALPPLETKEIAQFSLFHIGILASHLTLYRRIKDIEISSSLI